MITETPTVVPLIERLRRIPKKHKVSIAFQWAEDGTATGYSSIPVGYLMHTAADELAKLREELAQDYLTKNDFKDALRELHSLLERIDSKLDRKADRP